MTNVAAAHFSGVYPMLYAFFDQSGRLDRRAFSRQAVGPALDLAFDFHGRVYRPRARDRGMVTIENGDRA